ncbi:hypothetical protein [Streptomyces achromogenes]|uniref:hypothetical protein n=1 Tax=Streptomyces achromogenes TaxID=67255 RepID=UPI0033DC0C0A
MEIVVMAQDLGRGGWQTPAGEPQDRWPQIAATIQEVRPDLLLLQEAEGWAANGHARLIRAKQDLGMERMSVASDEHGWTSWPAQAHLGMRSSTACVPRPLTARRWLHRATVRQCSLK